MKSPNQTAGHSLPPLTKTIYVPPPQALLSRTRGFALLGALLLAAFAFVLNTTAVPPAMPDIAREFGVSIGTASLVSTLFLLSGASIGIVLTLASDRLGRRKVLLLVMAALLLGSLMSAWSPTFELLLIGRVIHGAGVAVFSVSYLLLRERMPTAYFGLALGAVAAMNNGIAGADAYFGGVLVDHFGYRSVFWTIFGVTLIASAAVLACVPRVEYRVATQRVDWRGCAAFALAAVAGIMFITAGGNDGWLSLPTVLWGVAAGIGIVAFVWSAQRATAPIIALRHLRSRQVWPLLATTTFSMAVYIGGISFAITVMGQDRDAGFGLSAATTALMYLTPVAVVATLVSPLAGWLADRFGWVRVLRIGALITVPGMVLIAVNAHHPWLVLLGTLIFGVGTGAIVLTMVSGLAVDHSPAESPAALSSLNGAAFSVGSALGVAVVAPCVNLATPAGYEAALWITAGFAAAAAVTALLLREVPTELSDRE